MLAIHHTRKRPPGETYDKGIDDILGSALLAAMSDTVWMMKRDGEWHEVECVKLRADPSKQPKQAIRFKFLEEGNRVRFE